ncbi:MAG TPA: hypothetical protein VKY74_21600 [Chloroflexia bacterium]|nr:hypothetical protein [Chloroflexia bacterium]
MKNTTRWITAISLLCTLGITLQPRNAYACSCAPPPPLAEDFRGAAAVFSGTVRAIQVTGHSPDNSTAQARPFLDPTAVVLDVTAAWKGVHQAQVVVHTGGLGIGCGFEFQSGQTYLVFAYQQGAELSTALCTRTADLSTAAADLQWLGRSQAPTGPGVPAAGDPCREPHMLFAYLGVAIGVWLIGLGLRGWNRLCH